MKPKSSVDRGHEPARVCAKIERQRTIDNMGLAPLQRGDNHSEKNDKMCLGCVKTHRVAPFTTHNENRVDDTTI